MNEYTIETGPKIRTWGGWYQHQVVKLTDGMEIGRIQVRRKNKRQDVLILDTRNACVLGHNIDWLLRRHQEAVS